MTWQDSIPALDAAGLSCADPADQGLDLDSLESEMDLLPHLDADKRYEAEGIERETIDARKGKAAEHLARIPGPRQALHLVTAGLYALWDTVPGILELAGAGARFESLHIATLGFSKANVAAMAEMLDSGRLDRLYLLCSHYFKGTSTPIYDYMAEQLAGRSNARHLSIRTHAKVMAMKLADGRTVTIEASANLRSCKNIEQLTVYGDPELYRFHAGWIGDLFERPHGNRHSAA